MKRFISLTVILSFALLALTLTATAQGPGLINYQGYLTDDQGDPVSGDYTMTFKIHDDPTGPNVIWEEPSQVVTVTEGLFEVILGQGISITDEVFSGDERWLQITVEGEDITPRTRLVNAPYAFRVSTVDGATGGALSGDVGVWSGNTALTLRNDGVNTYLANKADFAGNGADPGGELNLIGSNGVQLFYGDDGAVGFLGLKVQSDGNVGIANGEPSAKLDVLGNNTLEGEPNVIARFRASHLATSDAGVMIGSVNGNTPFIGDAPGGGTSVGLCFRTNNGERMRIDSDGNVGIGTGTPASTNKLHVVTAGDVDGTAAVYGEATFMGPVVEGEKSVPDWYVYGGLFQADNEYHGCGVFGIGGVDGGWFSGGSVGVRASSAGTGIWAYGGEYAAVLEGTTKTDVLEITGGSDLAEPFEMSGNSKVPPGALVVIDDQNPGKLKLSGQPYDTRVAGIVSGAGGINPGLTLTQESMFDDGQNVAISGRVYALADASHGAIKPGDLLTTSSTPGHAMKATDRDRAYGAVIGKAMTGLEEGQGLVLVLVNLQ